jgi:hypothetical protein
VTPYQLFGQPSLSERKRGAAHIPQNRFQIRIRHITWPSELDSTRRTGRTFPLEDVDVGWRVLIVGQDVNRQSTSLLPSMKPDLRHP